MSGLTIEKRFKDSIIGKIPYEWSYSTLDHLAEINPKPIKLEDDSLLVSFVGMADVAKNSKLINTTNKSYNEVKKGFTSFYEGDVLVAKITPCFENGKGALAHGLTNNVGFGSTEFHVLRAKLGRGDPQFIHHVTTTFRFRAKGEMNMTGTAGQKRVGKDFIASYPIPCPPVKEQQRIATVLSTVDEKIMLIEQKIVETERLKTGLMQKLFSEGLGVQDENGNWEIHEEFQNTRLGTIPTSWDCLKLKTVCSLQGGFAFKSTSSQEEGVKWLKIANVGKREVIWKDKSYLPQSFVELHSDYVLFENDIVIALTRPVLGDKLKIAMLKPDDTPALLNQRVARINPNPDKIDRNFMYFLFENKEMASNISQAILGMDPPNISTKQIEEFEVPIPPLFEQQEIAKILTIVSEKLGLLVQQRTQTQQLKKGLMQKLFTGEWRVPVDNSEAS